ncbi:hypothetical protein EZS27_026557, partial [termite gut metagenome]
DLSNTSGCLWRRFLTSKNSKKNSKRYYRLSDTNTALIFIDYLFNNEELSLTAITKRLLNITHAIQPTGYWNYKEKNLRDIYDTIYTLEE